MADDLVGQCAANVMDTFHLMMRTIRSESHKRSPAELSMQQFRAMKIIEHNEGASLSLVADYLGATLSATSKLVDSLVERSYIRRETAKDDRRRLILALTPAGEQAIETIHMAALSCLAEKLGALSISECTMLNVSMDMLRSALAGQPNLQSE